MYFKLKHLYQTLLCSIVLTGCVESEWDGYAALTHTITIDSDFSNEQIEKTVMVINEWELATNNKFNVDINIANVSSKDYYSIVSVDKIKNAEINQIGEEVINQHGKVKILLIESKLTSPVLFENCVKHELGHYLGLQHNEYKNDLMYKVVDDIKVRYIEPHHIEEFNYNWGF